MNKKDKGIRTFTKIFITIITLSSILWITWSYVLATYAAIKGSYTIVESLSQTVCKVIIASVLGYLLKAFFETFCEKHNELVVNGYDKFHNPFSKTTDDSEYNSEQFMTNVDELGNETTETEDDVEEVDESIEDEIDETLLNDESVEDAE